MCLTMVAVQAMSAAEACKQSAGEREGIASEKGGTASAQTLESETPSKMEC